MLAVAGILFTEFFNIAQPWWDLTNKVGHYVAVHHSEHMTSTVHYNILAYVWMAWRPMKPICSSCCTSVVDRRLSHVMLHHVAVP